MKAEEIAIDLLNKFDGVRMYALICVDEIENALTEHGRESMELQNMECEFRLLDKVREIIKKQ